MTEQLYRRRAGTPVTLAECPVGLFERGGELCLKTEYSNNAGRIDAYIVSSGEFFWGAAPQTIASQRATVVTPIDYEPLPAPAPDAQRASPEPTDEAMRAELAEILETIARDKLDGPRDLDVALDAIICLFRGSA